ncbi:MAG: TIGR02221 family CRISPR-associated protein [Caldilinea sp.]|uniref:TIGR02221 family CRISPR-associated protein n=1 Tax=Caldilinea sp. TaxID=2293560 RepID=UPI002B5AA0C1|nr:TIGR02221 family CRISPR-associated protein [Anaerolineales bacterium]HQY94395.1 TIGR02221 family CRISPR-associated protein [Caldilinea sp.]HRA68260.1 TIGR02221 family CRISPR-associated protein [Caldilinea sp.]
MKAITFLGATTAYETTYVLDDGREHTAPFFGVALARFVPDLSLRVFVTKQAREKHLDRFVTLVEDYVADVDPVDIPDGRNDTELWEIFQTVVDAVEPKESVVFDITHGFRSLPFLSFLSAAYLRTVKNIRLEAVYYGNFEARDQSVTPNRAPVINLTRFVDLLDWMVGADRFVRFGDARDLAALLNTQHERTKPDPRIVGKVEMATWNSSPVKKTASHLRRASQALRVVRPSEAMAASHAVSTQLPEALMSITALAQPFAPLSQYVAENFAPIALSAEEQRHNPQQTLVAERALIKWYLQRNQIFQAVALAREWLVSWVMVHSGLVGQMLEKDVRQQVERAIGREIQRLQDKTMADNPSEVVADLSTVPALGDVAQLYNRLGQLRNDLMHAGKRKGALTADTVESTAKLLCQKLAELRLDSSLD